MVLILCILHHLVLERSCNISTQNLPQMSVCTFMNNDSGPLACSYKASAGSRVAREENLPASALRRQHITDGVETVNNGHGFEGKAKLWDCTSLVIVQRDERVLRRV